MLVPKLFTTLKDYSFRAFSSDLIAGIIVGIVALPLAIAFAIASGVSPDRGLVTAVIAGFIISFLGGSRVQIGGPTGAFVVIVYSIIQKHGIDGLIIANIMAGLILILMGAAKFGGVIKFIPYPVTVGFTSGIAVIIFTSQIKDLFGLEMGTLPPEFTEKLAAYGEHFHTLNPAAAVISGLCLLILVYWKRVSQRIPGSLIALLFATGAVAILQLPVETIGSRFGSIPSTLPAPVFPAVTFERIRELIPAATTIALLAGIESLLSAVIADGMIGGKHRSNMELIAQGVANVITPLFGGIPATGAIARTTTNVHNGGRTPVAGIVHALTLLVIMLFFAKWAVHIFLCALAAILVIVSYHMSEWRSFKMVLKSPKSDVIVLITTFGLTVLVDLTVAIEVGMVLAAFLFMHRMSLVTNVDVVTREFSDDDEKDDPNAISRKSVPEGVEVYEINGPFFFGASYKFLESLNATGIKNPRVRILRMRNVGAIDATGMRVLKQVFQDSQKKNIAFILSGIKSQPLQALENSGLLEMVGPENVLPNIDDALRRAGELLKNPAKTAF